MFSVSDGRQTQLSAVMLSEDDSAGQYQTRLTNALRRVGVQVHQQADGISFSTTEKQWPDIERTLSVRTDGDKSAFMPLKTFAEPSQAVRLAQSLQQGGAGISQTLESINQQRADGGAAGKSPPVDRRHVTLPANGKRGAGIGEPRRRAG